MNIIYTCKIHTYRMHLAKSVCLSGHVHEKLALYVGCKSAQAFHTSNKQCEVLENRIIIECGIIKIVE